MILLKPIVPKPTFMHSAASGVLGSDLPFAAGRSKVR